MSRLHALANAHGLLLNAAGEGALLDDIVRGQLASFAGAVSIDGPRIFLKPNAAQSFALVIHELATNASKHGALPPLRGRVAVNGPFAPLKGHPKLHFRWQERGGPPVKKPTRKGFGTVLLEHAIAGIDSAPTIDFAPAGLTYETETALSMLVPTGNHSPMAEAAPSSMQLNLRRRRLPREEGEALVRPQPLVREGYFFQRAPSTNPMTAATPKVAMGCSFIDLST